MYRFGGFVSPSTIEILPTVMISPSEYESIRFASFLSGFTNLRQPISLVVFVLHLKLSPATSKMYSVSIYSCCGERATRKRFITRSRIAFSSSESSAFAAFPIFSVGIIAWWSDTFALFIILLSIFSPSASSQSTAADISSKQRSIRTRSGRIAAISSVR